MFGIVLVGAVLILAILVVIYRVSVLINVAKGTDKKRVTGWNNTNSILFAVFLVLGFGAFFYFSSTEFDKYVMPIASEQGTKIDTLFWVTMAITGVVFVITHILLFLFPLKYQYREDRKAYYYPHNNKLELIWTVVPAIVLAVLVFTGWRTWVGLTSAPPQETEVIEIMGYQFAFMARYPGGDGVLGPHDYKLIDADNQMGINFGKNSAKDDFIPREVHLPKGKPVQFMIRARDVLHNVYAPHFRMKMDAVPGMRTSYWFTPTKTTEEMREELGNPDFNYEIVCNQICGRGHFGMRLVIYVDEPQDYEAWYAEQESWASTHEDYIQEHFGNVAAVEGESENLASVE